MVDKPSIPNLPGLKPTPPIVKPGRPEVNPLTGKAVINPLHPPEVEAAQAAFDASVIALEEATAGRNITSIPLSDGYWAAAHTHQVAYLALKDAYREIPISSPPDSDMIHDVKMAVDAMKRGEPRATGMSALLSGTISVPVDNVPEEFQPFQRAQIPLGTKLVTAVEQPMEEAVIDIVIPPPPPDPPARITE